MSGNGVVVGKTPDVLRTQDVSSSAKNIKTPQKSNPFFMRGFCADIVFELMIFCVDGFVILIAWVTLFQGYSLPFVIFSKAFLAKKKIFLAPGTRKTIKRP